MFIQVMDGSVGDLVLFRKYIHHEVVERGESESTGRKLKSWVKEEGSWEPNLNPGSSEIPLYSPSRSLHDAFGGSEFGV